MSLEQARPRFASNPAYLRCQRLLKQLQELMAAGEGESARADDIRDAMEETRSGLDPAESRRIEELSADLYMLTDEEIFQEVPAEQRALLPARVRDAFQARRYEEVLALLRANPEGLSPEMIAYVRGRCWSALRDYEAAAWFFDYAGKLRPSNPSFAALALDAVWKAGRQSDAVEQARTVIANLSTHPRVLFVAAQVLARWAQQQAKPTAAPDHARVVEAVARALERENALPEAHRIPSVTFLGRIDRARSLEQLGRKAEAREAHAGITRDYPTSSEAWILAGLFEIRMNDGQAEQYFKQAVELHTRHAWPYLYLAHRRLVNGQFQAVIDLCRSGIQHTADDEERARFYEWSAIARHALGDPDQTVRELFNTAVALDPLNILLRHNRDAFEKFVAAQHAGPPPEFEASPAPDSAEVMHALSASVAQEAQAA
jgi:tetratricopeptide (TPR) repeat protein